MSTVRDPRKVLAMHRLECLDRVLLIVSPKGGVGKSFVAYGLSRVLNESGFKVGILDLDLYNPCIHKLMGIDVTKTKPVEDKGILPIEYKGIKIMTIAFYSLDMPTPLRGNEVMNALLELIAITRWIDTEILIVDTPPGLGDVVLELFTIVPRDKTYVIAVTTPSELAIKACRNIVKVVLETGLRLAGVVENMVRKQCVVYTDPELSKYYLGSIPFDPELEERIARNELDKSCTYDALKRIGSRVTEVIGLGTR